MNRKLIEALMAEGDDEQMYTVKDVAALFRVSLPTVHRWLGRKLVSPEIRGGKGRLMRFSRKNIDELKEALKNA